jgi:hypothetical protein
VWWLLYLAAVQHPPLLHRITAFLNGGERRDEPTG